MATVEGLKAELAVLLTREAEILAEATQLREAGAPAERVKAMMAKAELLRPRMDELQRQIRELQEH
ncbi:MAG TPA: hypothetical protein VLK85_07670 [Ramlibacter sp.]|nr:hypothetical protein [Ramlibacter sp.]